MLILDDIPWIDPHPMPLGDGYPAPALEQSASVRKLVAYMRAELT